MLLSIYRNTYIKGQLLQKILFFIFLALKQLAVTINSQTLANCVAFFSLQYQL